MLFAYGTLQDPDILAAVLGRTVAGDAIQAAQAPGFAVVYYPGRVYPALVAIKGQEAQGMMIEGLDAADLAVLDAFEGDEYRRVAIEIRLRGALVEAHAYLPVIDIPADGEMWSLQEWTRTHKPMVFATEVQMARDGRRRLSEDRRP